jgi:hypothetical protein
MIVVPTFLWIFLSLPKNYTAIDNPSTAIAIGVSFPRLGGIGLKWQHNLVLQPLMFQ